MLYFLLIILLTSKIQQSDSQINQIISDKCSSKIICSDCIQSAGCGWCMDPNFGDRARCFQPELQQSRGICKEEMIFNPDSSHTIIMNMALTMGQSIQQNSEGSMGTSQASRNSNSSRLYQIKPQRYSLKTRINQPQRFEFSYAQAEDYPVDLYYLMDVSKSMEDDKENLSKLGDLLSSTMKNLTSNFRLGFGTFVDKVLMPYVSVTPKKLRHPCNNCEAPYGYKNHLPLSDNAELFVTEVNKVGISGNLDEPEGGLDALMQAIVCKEIGWRQNSRKLLLYSSDAGYHQAGDGKLGGIIAPNDGECHLHNNVYTYSNSQDHPSISQINRKIVENTINVIFAVSQRRQSLYRKLSRYIEGSMVGLLSSDSSNIVELIKSEYQKITSSVTMKSETESYIQINYYSACLNSDGNKIKTKTCDNLRVGDEVKFTAEITVTECPKDKSKWKQLVKIQPIGVEEYLLVELDIICDCECEHENHPSFRKNAVECKYHGTYKCGTCECRPDYFGRTCECSNLDYGVRPETFTGCRQDNTTAVDCSGRGNCVCNVCECERRNPNEVISGKYCECDNFSCDRHEKLLCSGPDHGECSCGQCVCKPGWKGGACDCKDSNATCIPPNGGEICSGHGKCECGQCVCDKTDERRYSGKHCERCPTCAGRCEELRDCVECQMYKTGILKDICAENCTLFTPVEVEKTVVDTEKNEYLCQFYDEDDCTFQFVYTEVEDGKIEVRAEKDRKCHGACHSKDSNATCIPPNGGEICSGHGICECGRCVCAQPQPSKGRFSGQYCEFSLN